LSRQREQAITLTSQTAYEHYQKYLAGCVEQFRKGTIDVMQFCMRCN
jgi:cyclopropane-fatty-acyl-phospholipid synthase